MSVEQIKEAARKWNMRLDSATIAKQMGILECTVWANLWCIRAQAAAYRMAA